MKVAARKVIKARKDYHTLRSEEHTSELQSLAYLVCRLLLEKKNILNSLPPTTDTPWTNDLRRVLPCTAPTAALWNRLSSLSARRDGSTLASVPHLTRAFSPF